MDGFHYSVFGFSLQSNLRIPGLPLSASRADSAEIQVHMEASPGSDHVSDDDTSHASLPKRLTYVSSYTSEDGQPALRVWEITQGAILHLVYSDGTQFWLDRKGSTVWVSWSELSSLENAASYLLGPVLGLLLRLRGVVCLHASAVAFADRCVAFVGGEGAGKSTTAAAFAKFGFGIVADDIVGLVEREGRFYVLPAYPHLCLWPESVEMLYGSPEALPRLLHNWEKRRLALGEDGTRFEDRSLPLDAVYILGSRRTQAAPQVSEIPTREVLLSLVANTYATNLIDRDMRGEEFAVLSRLASNIRVRVVHPSDDPARIEDLCWIIREDFDAQAQNLTRAAIR